MPHDYEKKRPYELFIGTLNCFTDTRLRTAFLFKRRARRRLVRRLERRREEVDQIGNVEDAERDAAFV